MEPEETPTEAASAGEILREQSEVLAHFIQQLPPSRESSLATTKLDEFFFWASAAIRQSEAAAAAAEDAVESESGE